MSPTPYVLLTPIIIEKRVPGRDGAADKVEKRTVVSFNRKAIKGHLYFTHGDVDFLAQSPGGASFTVELDEVIEAYVRYQIDDPDAALIFDGVKLADAVALRQDVLDLFEDATSKAREARAGSDPEAVTLLEPPTFHDERVTTIKLTEPTHRTFARLGRPFTWSRTPDGAVQPMERMSVIRAYLDKCITHELGADLLPTLGLADAMQLKRAILGFFTRAAVAVNGRTSSTPSSSREDTSSSTPATP